MNAPVRTFAFAPAVRDRVSLLIALAGASGSGKTLSALKIARGLAGGDDGKIAFIDTEARRGLHYAVAPGEKPGPDRFAFQHGDLRAPFTPEAYAAAIKAADAAGFDVIVVDSCSHEYEGEGGLHDMHDDLVAAAVAKSKAVAEEKGWRFDEAQARDRASVGAWNEPKMRHKRFVARLLQCRAHLILCLRADEKIRIEKVKDDRGRERTVIVQPKDMPPKERWVPICEKRFMYEMTLSLVLTPHNPGVPVEIKLQQQHRAAVPLDKPLSETTGLALAAWASGGQPSPRAADSAAPSPTSLPANESGAADVFDVPAMVDRLKDEISGLSNVKVAKAWAERNAATINALPEDAKLAIRDSYVDRKAELEAAS
jgi:hypothetical protein